MKDEKKLNYKIEQAEMNYNHNRMLLEERPTQLTLECREHLVNANAKLRRRIERLKEQKYKVGQYYDIKKDGKIIKNAAFCGNKTIDGVMRACFVCLTDNGQIEVIE